LPYTPSIAAAAARGQTLATVFHDPYGWWVREAGASDELSALSDRVAADVAIVGGGYLGMWTAWQVLERDPGARVVIVERHRCGFGPSGRNGGFVSNYWGKIDAMVDKWGVDAALRLGAAAERAVVAIGEWCESQGVDAWYRAAGEIEVAAARGQEGYWSHAVEAAEGRAPAGEFVALTAAQVADDVQSPAFGGGAFMRTAATVQPARLAFGLRERLLGRGVRIFERSSVTRVADSGSDVTVEVDGGRGAVRAPRAVLAVNHVAGALRPFRRMVTTGSSHIVLTAPAPEALAAIGWRTGLAVRDCRTMLHYFRTTDDDRMVFGWGGGRMGYGSRRRAAIDVDPDVTARAEATMRRFFPALRHVPVEAAWGGPIDVSPIRLPQYRQVGRVVAGFGFSGNGVGPSYLGGQILSAMAVDARDEFTRLPLVDPAVPRFPPEPFRFVGGELIRAAMVRADDDADAGRGSAPHVAFLAGLPKRLGMSLPR
jgi:glycine/D-amino acid oxidase-like deaminating enzyme